MCLCDSPRLLRALLWPAAAAAAAAATVEGRGGEEKSGAADGSGESASDDSTAKLVMSQLALSDRVLLNKSDLLSPEEVRASTVVKRETLYLPVFLPKKSTRPGKFASPPLCTCAPPAVLSLYVVKYCRCIACITCVSQSYSRMWRFISCVYMGIELPQTRLEPGYSRVYTSKRCTNLRSTRLRRLWPVGDLGHPHRPAQ